ISRTQVRTKLRKRSNEYLSHEFRDALQKAFDVQGFKDVEVLKVEEGDPDQDPVQIAVYYPQVTEESEYIEPNVKLEIGSRSMRDPFTSRKFSSFVGEAFPGRDFADDNISVPCVNPERTFLEKIFLLHEEFQRPQEKIRVNRLSRHLYDIQKIAQTHFAGKALEDKALYRAIVAHRKKFSRLGSVDYEKHFSPFLNPLPTENLLEAWEKDYKKMQSEMIYETDSLPFPELIQELRSLVSHINKQKF
ncbi:MAG: nucleotidyl transferase AbiEii/AbiGii toxin family protein, partial [Bacteroidota bacterium]